jgi:hypothetical protein
VQVEAGWPAPSVADDANRLGNPEEQDCLTVQIVAEKFTRNRAVVEVQTRQLRLADTAGWTKRGFRCVDRTRIAINGPAAPSVIVAVLGRAFG